MQIQKKKKFGRGEGWGSGQVEGVDLHEELKFFVKIHKKKWGGGSGLGWSGKAGGQGGCERRSGSCENSKKKSGGGGGGGREDPVGGSGWM